MLIKKKIIIDIRTSEEILEKRLLSYSDDTILMFIPVSHIGFNKSTIQALSKTNLVYIICKKAKRSTYVKQKYFSNDKNIISIDGGINKLETMHLLMRKLKVIVYKIKKQHKSIDYKSIRYKTYGYYLLLIMIIFLYIKR
jgi:hypothetical protein